MNCEFSIAELRSALKPVNARSAPGPDKITYAALRNLDGKSQQALLQAYNTSWQQGRLPHSWKEAMVVPILKPGKPPTALSSFRPVSLTSCMGKLMERMVLHRLEWWMEKQGVFPQEMAGFRRHRSSLDPVLDLVSTVQQARAHRRIVVAVFLDIKRAYDTVSHVCVLHALRTFGLSGRMFSWLKDFLTDRSVCVRTSNGSGSQHAVPQGVPQGSILSPILFNVVMAGLTSIIPRKVAFSIYADDVAIWTKGKSRPAIQRRLQLALNNIHKYFTQLGMDISPEKCAELPFTRKAMVRFPLYVGLTQLEAVRYHRFLGVVIDSELRWTRHVKYLEAKAQRWICAIQHLAGPRWGCDQHCLLGVHRALIRATVLYSLPVLHR
ncbi:RNA-directed DNA polymerase, partial [Bradyrhizobium sp. 33ap4]|uniref:RNA-directed DNA polymerase n=1 Tax=Bradyrhizobium sp. 33ap4 TaxID=3061630 RepID=UPI0039775F92